MTVSDLYYPSSATVLAPVATCALTDERQASPRTCALPSADCDSVAANGCVRFAASYDGVALVDNGGFDSLSCPAAGALATSDASPAAAAFIPCARAAACDTTVLSVDSTSAAKGQGSLPSVAVHSPHRSITASASHAALANTQMRSSNDHIFAVSINQKTLLSLTKVSGSRPAVLTVAGIKFSVFHITVRSCGKPNWYTLRKLTSRKKLYLCSSGGVSKGAVFSFEASDVNGLSALLLSGKKEYVAPLDSRRLYDPLADLRAVIDAAAVQLARHKDLLCSFPKRVPVSDPVAVAGAFASPDSQVLCRYEGGPVPLLGSRQGAVEGPTSTVARKPRKVCPAHKAHIKAFVAKRNLAFCLRKLRPLSDMIFDPCRGYAGNAVYLDAMQKLWSFFSGLCQQPDLVDSVVAVAAAVRRRASAPIQPIYVCSFGTAIPAAIEAPSANLFQSQFTSRLEGPVKNTTTLKSANPFQTNLDNMFNASSFLAHKNTSTSKSATPLQTNLNNIFNASSFLASTLKFVSSTSTPNDNAGPVPRSHSFPGSLHPGGRPLTAVTPRYCSPKTPALPSIPALSEVPSLYSLRQLRESGRAPSTGRRAVRATRGGLATIAEDYDEDEHEEEEAEGSPDFHDEVTVCMRNVDAVEGSPGSDLIRQRSGDSSDYLPWSRCSEEKAEVTTDESTDCLTPEMKFVSSDAVGMSSESCLKYVMSYPDWDLATRVSDEQLGVFASAVVENRPFTLSDEAAVVDTAFPISENGDVVAANECARLAAVNNDIAVPSPDDIAAWAAKAAAYAADCSVWMDRANDARARAAARDTTVLSVDYYIYVLGYHNWAIPANALPNEADDGWSDAALNRAEAARVLKSYEKRPTAEKVLLAAVSELYYTHFAYDKAGLDAFTAFYFKEGVEDFNECAARAMARAAASPMKAALARKNPFMFFDNPNESRVFSNDYLKYVFGYRGFPPSPQSDAGTKFRDVRSSFSDDMSTPLVPTSTSNTRGLIDRPKWQGATESVMWGDVSNFAMVQDYFCIQALEKANEEWTMAMAVDQQQKNAVRKTENAEKKKTPWYLSETKAAEAVTSAVGAPNGSTDSLTSDEKVVISKRAVGKSIATAAKNKRKSFWTRFACFRPQVMDELSN